MESLLVECLKKKKKKREKPSCVCETQMPGTTMSSFQVKFWTDKQHKNNMPQSINMGLYPFQNKPFFNMSAVQADWKHCGKRKNSL